ncbi:guanosine-3':5'-bis(diphosphate) 3'-pyrophosphohydrolase MESH1-like isoform X1 [Leptotrombidium deliense]|uniref:Guanosine-3',5'-bis(diphosphate) 3'-pyrophosphohydrolase MESH1 n=1 Tax=Leptotrombidium deliense TaxID=299467 RepID=A0A443RV93_9ACAR|nr:guanosine-3':5'-bis(diphosphate) 3'-pyrophosphohydrolase MESH1-like isoform X1 [Leptotrombidium deliense]
MSLNVAVREFDDNMARFVAAVDFAAVKHKDQRRKDPQKTPYINHPIGVANLLVSIGKVTDSKVLIAAVLHDTVEDTDTTLEEIQEKFGIDIRNIVAEVTDNKSLPKEERKRLQIVHAPTLSSDAKLVKLADKLYNLQDLLRQTPENWTEGRVDEYFKWAANVIKGLVGTNQFLKKEVKNVLAEKNVFID